MANINDSITDLIGNTPLLELHRYRRNRGLGARIRADPCQGRISQSGGQHKGPHRLVPDAQDRNLLRPGGTIVDVTSGNTGIGLAAAHGYKAKFYASDNISPDKFRLLEHYGAEVVRVPNSFFLAPDALEKITEIIRNENPEALFHRPARQLG